MLWEIVTQMIVVEGEGAHHHGVLVRHVGLALKGPSRGRSSPDHR
jgi:hypothetical protein